VTFTNEPTKFYLPPTFSKFKNQQEKYYFLLIGSGSLIFITVTEKKASSLSRGAKPSAPSCEGSGEEAPGIEPVHPSCGGVPIPPNSLYRWATEAF
jgi:hypothetical protein